MQIRNYLNTFSFRSGLILFLGLSITLIILRFMIYTQSINGAYVNLQKTIDSRIEEISGAMDRYGADYVKNLVGAITNNMGSKDLVIAFYYDGNITGNLDDFSKITFLDKPDWQEIWVERPDGKSKLHLYVKVTDYSKNAKLLVGSDLSGVDILKETLFEALLVNLVISFLLSFALSAILVWLLNRHLAKLNYACQYVMAGNLNYRINITSKSDQFDKLGNNINNMLDWINILLSTIGDSSNALAHDMRTPLSHIRLELSALSASSGLPDKTKHKLLNVVERIDYLANMFDNILQIAKAESRSGTDLFTPIDLVSLLKDVLEFYQPMLEEKEIKLSLLLPEAELIMQGDKQLLSQAIVNIIDNAIKFSPQNGNIDISLQINKNDESVEQIELKIKDEGPGVAPEFLDKVKERFFRVEKSRHTIGSGLGLSLVNAVAKLHGGSLQFENNYPGLTASIIFSK